MLILLVNMLGLFLLKDKKCVSILNAFRKRIKIWVDKESKSYNSSFKKWLWIMIMIMILKYIRYIRKKNLLFAERFMRTLKTKIYKYMTSVSKNVYIDKLDDIA